MIIDLTTLNSEDLAKVPLSIRLNTIDNIIDTDNLPLEVAYELRNIKLPESNYVYVDDSTFDLIPSFSVYSDFTSLNTKKLAVIEYVKNYLIIDKGDYPFDPSFGTLIKTYLQRLDMEPAKISIDQELTNLANALVNSFKIPIQMSSINLERIENNASVEYKLNLGLQVSDIRTNITFQKSIDTYML
jgi:hypothetical protein